MRAKLGKPTALTVLVPGRRLSVFSGISARRALLDLLGRRALRAVICCRPARPALAARGSRVCGHHQCARKNQRRHGRCKSGSHCHPFRPCAPGSPLSRGMSGSGGLESVSSPAIRRGPIIKRIVIDVSVVSIEAVVAGIGATVAPIVAVPAGPDMALAIDRSEIRRSGRNAGATESGGRHCNRNKETFHGDNRA